MAFKYMMKAKVKKKLENLIGTTLRCRYCFREIEVGQDVIVYRGHLTGRYFHVECDEERRL